MANAQRPRLKVKKKKNKRPNEQRESLVYRPLSYNNNTAELLCGDAVSLRGKGSKRLKANKRRMKRKEKGEEG
jgi:hypothetical protein